MCKKRELYQAVIIIGAGRSGTNMLRDVLTRIPGFGTWPCDEINYIWRHGNARYESDEFPPVLARPKVISYIQSCFEKIAKRFSLAFVVEKTCANSLRVQFVDRIVPDSRYIFIHRDGRDAVASAMKRWMAPLDIPYLLTKARYVPLPDVPYYASRYFLNRIRKLLSREKRLSAWGPRFEGMSEMVRSRPLLEVCALQWVRCVKNSLDQLAPIDPGRIHRVKYENFVAKPKRELENITRFLGLDLSETELDRLVLGVTDKSVGNWQRAFSDGDLKVLEPILMYEMKRLGTDG
jgi:hypothetical protein